MILFINTPNEGCKTFPVRHRATVSFGDTDESMVLTRYYVTGKRGNHGSFCVVRSVTEQCN